MMKDRMLDASACPDFNPLKTKYVLSFVLFVVTFCFFFIIRDITLHGFQFPVVHLDVTFPSACVYLISFFYCHTVFHVTFRQMSRYFSTNAMLPFHYCLCTFQHMSWYFSFNICHGTFQHMSWCFCTDVTVTL